MTRSFGNEKYTTRDHPIRHSLLILTFRIRITFTIADLTMMDQDADSFPEDRALYDEDIPADAQSGGANTKGAINQGTGADGNFKVAPEDSVSPADREGIDDQGRDESFPARVNITIEKPGVPGAIHVESTARDGEILIDNVYYFKKSEFADAKTAEQDWSRRIMYTGPPFGNLDEGLQSLLEEYLSERGVDSSLAQFIPDYIDYKEQREYVDWLSGKRAFISHLKYD